MFKSWSLLIICLCSILPLYAEAEPGKIYVHPNQVLILSEGIFYIHQNEYLPVRSVSMDSQGMFVQVDADAFYWCPICKRYSQGGYCQYPDCPAKGR